MKRITIVGIVAATALLTSLAQVVIGGTNDRDTGVGTSLTAVKTANVGGETSSTQFQRVPGASTTVRVPANEKALILVRLSGESLCSASDVGQGIGHCNVRILIGGKVAHPDVAGHVPFSFDTTPHICQPDTGTDYVCGPPGGWSFDREAHSTEQWRTVGPGTHRVEVLFNVSDPGVTFALSRATLVVEQFAA